MTKSKTRRLITTFKTRIKIQVSYQLGLIQIIDQNHESLTKTFLK